MRLLITGAFLRCARNARLLATPLIPECTLLRPSKVVRFQSTQSKPPIAKSFPEQSVLTSAEVDPRKTSQISEKIGDGQPSTAKSKFRKYLQSQPEENKIIFNSTGESGTKLLGQPFVFDNNSNLSPSILNLVGRNLYSIEDHPLGITRKLIESVFEYPTFKNHVATNPVVTTNDNFDVLGFPADHPGRSRTDTYYVDSSHVLRTHTSAHQHAAFQYMNHNPEVGYTVCADVYRRDSIDRSHFPVFHQMEGARLWQLEPKVTRKVERKETRLELMKKRRQQILTDLDRLPKHNLQIIDDAGDYNPETNPVQIVHDEKDAELVGQHLKRSLEQLVVKVFSAAQQATTSENQIEPSEQLKVRWIEAYFPFTSPSWELEVFWQGEWLEILGCGVVQQSILNNAGLNDRIGWAWGIGIERLAMLLFNIPDIRLFWSEDGRFLSQFRAGKISRYVPISKYPACYKDVAFWIRNSPAGASPVAAAKPGSTGVAAAAGGDATEASPMESHPAAFHENDFMEIVRDVAGSLAENVSLVDEFVNKKTGRKSLCYRINYRSLEKTLTNEEANELHSQVVARLGSELPIELR